MVNLDRSVHWQAAQNVFGKPSGQACKPIDRELALIAFTNRSGSNLLADYMQASGAFSRAGEFLNPETMQERSQKREVSTLEDYILDIIDQTCGQSRIFALKASAEQVLVLWKFGILNMFRNVKVIHIDRNDVVAQAVSFSIAFQTKQWTKGQKKIREPYFDFGDIDTRLSAILKENQDIIQVSSMLELPKVNVSYELLERGPLVQIKRVFNHFSLNANDVSLSVPRLKKQRTELNDKYCKLFRNEILATLSR